MNGYGLIFAAAVLWGLIGLLSKGVLETGVGPLEVAFWRATLAGSLFVLHAGVAGGLHLASRRDLGALAGFALLGVTVFFAAFTLAVEAGGVSLAVLLLYSAPAFVGLLAWGLLGEVFTVHKAALTLLTLVGVALVAGSGGEGVRVTVPSLSWGLLAGISYGSHYVFGKWVLRRYAPPTIYAFVLPLGALGLLPFVDFSPKSPPVWGLLAALAFFSTYLAYGLYYTGLKQVEASRAVLVASIEPVVAGVLAALIFGERLGRLGLVGGTLILLAGVLASLPERAGAAATHR